MPCDLDRIFGADHAARWLAVHELCADVSQRFAEPLREDLASDATLHVLKKLHRVDRSYGDRVVAYLRKIAYTHMRRGAKKWRKQGKSLDVVTC